MPTKPIYRPSYGLLVTYNSYTGLWYCFDRADNADFWSGLTTRYTSGNTASEAMRNYKENPRFIPAHR